MNAIFCREMRGYFHTSAGYIFAGAFLTMGAVFFSITNLAARSSNVPILLSELSGLWIFLLPVLSMRMFAGERRQHTDVLLLTAPVSLTGLVMGKFLAGCAVILLTTALTLVYPLLIAIYGTVYPGELMVCYLGFVLQGCAFLALDALLSAMSKSPVAASLLALCANLLLWVCDLGAEALGAGLIADILSFISLYARYAPFTLGQLSYASLVYYLCFIFVCLLLCVRTLDERRVKGA